MLASFHFRAALAMASIHVVFLLIANTIYTFLAVPFYTQYTYAAVM